MSDGWEPYFQHFEHLLTECMVNKIEDSDDKPHLLLALSDGIRSSYVCKIITIGKNLTIPKSSGQHEDLQKFKRHFSPKPVKITECYQFYNRKQYREGSVAEYQAELRKLASTCEFDNFHCVTEFQLWDERRKYATKIFSRTTFIPIAIGHGNSNRILKKSRQRVIQH